MRLPIILWPLVAALALVAMHAPAAETPPIAAPGPREAALDRLLSERGSPKAFDAAIATARQAGVKEQAILETRFLYHVDRRDDAALVALLPEMLNHRATFKLEDSAIFAVTEDWLAVVEYVQALAALAKDDRNAFKQHITEAFWLSPRQAAAFTPHIEQLRLADSMRTVKLDFSLTLAPLAVGDPVSLSSLIAGQQAMLLHFWSPRSRECEEGMTDFAATAKALAAHKIAVVSLVAAGSPNLLTDARAMIQPLGDKPPGAWLVDSAAMSLARTMRVQNLPTVVLVAPSGNILYNGEPSADAFWQALRKLDANVTRPQATPSQQK